MAAAYPVGPFVALTPGKPQGKSTLFDRLDSVICQHHCIHDDHGILPFQCILRLTVFATIRASQGIGLSMNEIHDHFDLF
jgi:hypothetical protein